MNIRKLNPKRFAAGIIGILLATFSFQPYAETEGNVSRDKASTAPVIAQTNNKDKKNGSISGVYKSQNGKSFSNKIIYLTSLNREPKKKESTVTDSEGNFKFTNLTDGAYKVNPEYFGDNFSAFVRNQSETIYDIIVGESKFIGTLDALPDQKVTEVRITPYNSDKHLYMNAPVLKNQFIAENLPPGKYFCYLNFLRDRISKDTNEQFIGEINIPETGEIKKSYNVPHGRIAGTITGLTKGPMKKHAIALMDHGTEFEFNNLKLLSTIDKDGKFDIDFLPPMKFDFYIVKIIADDEKSIYKQTITLEDNQKLIDIKINLEPKK